MVLLLLSSPSASPSAGLLLLLLLSPLLVSRTAADGLACAASSPNAIGLQWDSVADSDGYYVAVSAAKDKRPFALLTAMRGERCVACMCVHVHVHVHVHVYVYVHVHVCVCVCVAAV